MARVAAFVAGLILIYISLFFTKNDDGKVQNWLVELWVRVEQVSAEKSRRTIFLLNTIARRLDELLDKIFGPKLLSLRFVGISITLSIASLNVLAIFHTISVNESTITRIAWFVGMASVPAWLAAEAATHPRPTVAVLGAAIAIVILYWGNQADPISTRNAFAGTASGVILDCLFVAVSRMILRRLKVEERLQRMISVLFINLLLGLFLLGPSLIYVSSKIRCFVLGCGWIASHPFYFLAAYIFSIASATNLLGGLCTLSIFFVTAVALFHRAVWPIASKLIHVCYERRIVERRMACFSVGAALLGYAFRWLSWIANLRSLSF